MTLDDIESVMELSCIVVALAVFVVIAVDAIRRRGP